MSRCGKRGVGKRGVAKCKKKIREEDMYIEFDANFRVVGANAIAFSSRLGKIMRTQFPYWLKTKEIDKESWKNLWLQLKEIWHIPNDDAEKYIISLAKKMRTDALSKMYRKYKDTGINPCTLEGNAYLDSTKWDAFVAERSTEEAREISEKASRSAKQNKNPARMGRTGYGLLEQELNKIWPDLIDSDPTLANMEYILSKLYVAARRKKDPETGTYDIGYLHEITTKLIEAEKKMKLDGYDGDRISNPITQVIGPEHGGRTRAVSTIIGKTKVQAQYFKNNRERVNASPRLNNVNPSRQSVDPTPGYHKSSRTSSRSHIVHPDIEEVCRCELLYTFNSSRVDVVIANGQAYPTSDRYLDDMLMQNHCVKVQVDYVNQDFLKVPVPDESIKKDEIMFMKDTLNMFIQWPRRAIKILNTMTNTASRQFQTSCQTNVEPYIPEMCLSPQFHQLETDIEFVNDDDFLNATNNYGCMGFGLSAYEEPQTLLQQQMPQSHQPNPKQSKRKRKAKGKENHAKAKKTDKEKRAEKVRESLNLITSRPQWFQRMVQRLQNHIGNDWNTQLEYVIDNGMFPMDFTLHMESESVLQLFINKWVDLAIVFWFTSYFFDASNDKPNRCAFLNVNIIIGDMCISNRKEVEEHIYGLHTFHADKQYLLAPFLANGHWTLFIIAPKKAQVYILDSLMTGQQKDQSDYLLSEVIESAFRDVNFTFSMVPCKQQTSSWECGYMVLKYMYDFVYIYQELFPDIMWNDTSVATETDINNFIKNIMPLFFQRLKIP